MSALGLVLLGLLAGAFAFPTDQVISKLDTNGPRYDYMEDDAGQLHLVDYWLKMSDLKQMARYNPDSTNRYHLFTRLDMETTPDDKRKAVQKPVVIMERPRHMSFGCSSGHAGLNVPQQKVTKNMSIWTSNPIHSQVLVLNNAASVRNSFFNRERRTIVLMHGFAGSAISDFNTVLVPAFLNFVNCNVIVVDWSSGSFWGPNAIQAAQAAGRFLTWMNSISGATPDNYHIVGFSVGGHGAAIMARTVSGDVDYVTGLDPVDRWQSAWLFRANDGLYTEIIHTDIGTIGIAQNLAHVDFYPNGGRNQPGCVTAICNHDRSFFFLGVSLRTSITGRRCLNLQEAFSERCTGEDTLRMGGIQPKTGQSGIFHVRTTARPPFSRG